MEVEKIKVEQETTLNMGNYESVKLRIGAEASGTEEELADLHEVVVTQLYDLLEASRDYHQERNLGTRG
jgi:hypothetical protein